MVNLSVKPVTSLNFTAMLWLHLKSCLFDLTCALMFDVFQSFCNSYDWTMSLKVMCLNGLYWIHV